MISQGQALPDVLVRVQHSSRIERISAFLNDIGGKRDVSGDDKVALFDQIDYPMIGHIESGRDKDAPDKGRRRSMHTPVGDEDQMDLGPFRRWKNREASTKEKQKNGEMKFHG